MSDPNPFGKSADEEDKNPFGRNLSEENPFGQKAEPAAPTLDRFGQPIGGTGERSVPPISRRESTQGRVSSAGGSFARGFGSILASVPKAVGEGAVALANKFGDDPIWGNPDKLTPEDTTSYQMGEAIEKWFNKFSVNPKYAEEFWASQIPQGAGSMVGFLAGGMAGRAAGIPALVTTMGLGATATGVEGVDDYLATLSKDEKADPKIREQALYWNSLLGTSEALPITQILNRLDKVSGGGVKKILKEGVKGGLEELTQEVLQSVGQNAVAAHIVGYDPDRGLFTGTQEAGEVGFTLGFMLNTLAATVGSRRGGRIQQREEQADSKAGLDRGEPLEATDVMGDEFTLELAEEETTQADLEAAPAPEAFEQQGDQDQAGVVPGVGGAVEAAEQEPTPEESTISYFDNRLKRDIYRDRLKSLVDDDLVPGGGIALVPDHNFIGGETDVRDENGRPQAPLVRTPSLNPDWFQSLMQDSNYQMSVEKIRQAADKAIAGERLGVRQARVLGAVLDHITTERTEAVDYAREQLRIAREARASAGLPEGTDWYFEESEYPDDYDGIERTFSELHDQAMQLDAALAEQVEALMESQRTDAEIIKEITKLIGDYNGRKIQASAEGLAAAQEQAAIQGAGIEPEPGIPAAAVPAADREPGRRPAEPAAAAEPGLTPPPIAPEHRAKAPAAPSEGVTPAEKKALLTDRRKKKQPGRKRERRDIGREDRRKQWLQRKKVEEMSEAERKAAIDELRKEIMTDPLTGLGSRAAWEAVEKKEFFAAIDADSLKYVNDELGNEAGDQLLKKIGAALKSEFGEDAYHVSGDEYWVHGDSMDDLAVSLDAVQQVLLKEIVRGPGGSMKGLGFSWGIAKTEAQADRDMKADKKERTKQGMRVERGEKPAGVVLKGETIEKVQPPAKQDLAAAKQEVGKKPEEKPAKKHPGKKKLESKPGYMIVNNSSQDLTLLMPHIREFAETGAIHEDIADLLSLEKVTVDGQDRILVDFLEEKEAFELAPQTEAGTIKAEETQKARAEKAEIDKTVEGFDLELEVTPAEESATQEDLFAAPKAPGKKKIDKAAHEAATSPKNKEPFPTEAQKQAGNYKLGHINVQGIDISIENPKGSERFGVDSDGEKWSVVMPAHYGYVKRSDGADGDNLDIYVGEDAQSDAVFIVNQISPESKKFDELKVIIGTQDIKSAMQIYFDGFSDGSGPARVGDVFEMNINEFKEYLKNGEGSKAIKRGKRDARPVPTSVIQNLAEYARQDKESKKPSLSQLRGKRDKGPSRTDKVQRVSKDRRREADTETSDRQDRQQRELQSRESALGDEERASAEHEKESLSDRKGRKEDADTMGRTDESRTIDDTLQVKKGDVGRRGGIDTSEIQRQEAEKYAEFEGRDITWDQLDENGNEITITVDAAEIMRDYDERIEGLEQLVKDCG